VTRRILVTNDDGVFSEGIAALAEALKPLGHVTVVAPATESSAVGHAITLIRPLRLQHLREDVYAVDGTPTDCVTLAFVKLFDREPDLVVSGINTGYNLGDDVTYSGTVAGALEGCLLGAPGIAVSLCRSRHYDFSQAASTARTVAEHVLEHGLPPRTFLNVNVPREKAHGIRVTVQSRRKYTPDALEDEDPRGRIYFWIREGIAEWDLDPLSDYQAVREGWISVTPLQPDLTNRDALSSLAGLNEHEPARSGQSEG
jgi:5'-nucleotidase